MGTTARVAALSVVLVAATLGATSVAVAQPHRQRPPPPAAPSTSPPTPNQPVAPDPATQRAHEAYDRGRALFQTGQWSEALAAFREAYDAKPHATVLLSVAECLDRLGEVRAAVTTLEQYLTAVPDARDREAVTQKIAALQQRPASLHVTSDPAGARLVVDGADTDLTTPADVELTPGAHALRLRLEGHVDREEHLTLEYAERREVAITLQTQAVSAPEVPSLPLRRPARPRSHAGAWVATTVTGVALATGAVLGVLALSARSDYEDGPTWALADRGDRLALAADIAFGTALAAGLTAFFAWIGPTAPPDERPAQVSLSPALPRGGAGVAARVDF